MIWKGNPPKLTGITNMGHDVGRWCIFWTFGTKHEAVALLCTVTCLLMKFPVCLLTFFAAVTSIGATRTSLVARIVAVGSGALLWQGHDVFTSFWWWKSSWRSGSSDDWDWRRLIQKSKPTSRRHIISSIHKPSQTIKCQLYEERSDRSIISLFSWTLSCEGW